MKHTLLILAVFALAITALHAQILPGTIPGVDPAIQAAVDKAIPQQYAGYTSLVILSLMMLGRWIKALQNGTGIKGWFSAIWMGTNTNKPMILIACLCMLTITSCSAMQKLGAALSTPQAKQIEIGLAQVGLVGAVAGGMVSPGDALTIAKGVAIVISADDGSSKTVKLAKLGLDTAVDKGVVKPGDVVTIKEVTAVITPAAAPAVPEVVELTSGK